MESSTPINSKRRETLLLEDQDESPIGQAVQNEASVSGISSSGCQVSMHPTGVSDELTKIHLTPPQTETSSAEGRGLYNTTFNLTKAAEGRGLIQRSTSLPDVCTGLENNQYRKRILTPEKPCRRTLSLDNISLSPWDLKVSREQRDTTSDPEPGEANLPYQREEDTDLKEDPQSTACDFQPDVGTAQSNEDQQSAACDFQSETDTAHTSDSQGAACDSHSDSVPGQAESGRKCGTTQILKNLKKLQGQFKTPKLILGKNASEELMETTPVGKDSPKRRLIWSPETPVGKSLKYSIGESASPSLKKRISGVISVNGRFAIPSNQQEVEMTTLGIKALGLNENGQSWNGAKKENKKRGSPTMKIGGRTPRGRGRRNNSRCADPKQKLISDMMQMKEENEQDSHTESGTQGQ